MKLNVCIDRGGTFTDCVAHVVGGVDAEQREFVVKLLSEDPANYDDAPREGIRRILELATKRPHPANRPLDTSHIASIRMATTVATNALLERKGQRFALLTTFGFKDLLHIGNQSRPDIFDLAIRAVPGVLYDRVVEVDERVTLVGYTAGATATTANDDMSTADTLIGLSGERVRILRPLDKDAVRKSLLHLASEGITDTAVSFMHAYTFPGHERLVRQVAQELNMGFRVTLSSDLMQMIKIVPRGNSTCVDAYLTPGIQRYLAGFVAGFDENLFKNVDVSFMQSDGGLAAVKDFSGFRAILSGPAGGVVGYANTTYSARHNSPVIGFDMGGTSTDVSRFAGAYEHVFETTTANVPIQAPQLDINTVAAGGGSCLSYRHGMMLVGPESAGAHPGPACYRKGGPLTVTDANLVLGRLVPEYFPAIFGPEENEPLDVQTATAKFAQLAAAINADLAAAGKQELSVEAVAYGFIQVANESMCRPIRTLTQAKGHDTKTHTLASFGGAGGQHACGIAKSLGIGTVYIHKHSSVLSAFGLALADVVKDVQEPCIADLNSSSIDMINERLRNLEETVRQRLQDRGFSTDSLEVERFLNLRYDGTDCALMTTDAGGKGFETEFLNLYHREFGFTLPDRRIIVDDVRVRVVGKSGAGQRNSPDCEEDRSFADYDNNLRCAVSCEECRGVVKNVYFDGGFVHCQVLHFDRIPADSFVQGPALLLDKNSTILLEPDCLAKVTASRNVVIRITNRDTVGRLATDLDPVQLSLFSHRFMSIAEQMGRTLQRTAISTNIKERLDFSCALFDSTGSLCANAPHIPVHLGSMQEAVRYQLKKYSADKLDENCVLVSNHPAAGGSHLPDITVITPVYNKGKLVFVVASRGHHADIGGISPGSMPPHSKLLHEEGAMIKSFKLVQSGIFQEGGITDLLLHQPAKYPGCTGTRNLRDNLSDLKAQIAANQRGIVLLNQLVAEQGLDVVQAYMGYIQQNAEQSVRELLKKIAVDNDGNSLCAVEHMDDGSEIVLKVDIDGVTGSATFDFTGTSMQLFGNANAPPSVTYSAIIYCLRSMVRSDIPLNQGCLNPVTVVLRNESFLCPSEEVGVVGGNVLTSQRLVDVILKAFGACAASQGCMNNVTFGMPADDQSGRAGWGYYETIAGGAGAGPDWQGRDGIHTHMTNTRITDPEIFERRYPVLLHQFGLRQGSGGQGEFRGGHGCVREIEFLQAMQVSILSERRVFRPYGLAGGGCGARGENVLIRDGIQMNLGGKSSIKVLPSDRIRISTPGGGGYGPSRA